VTVERVGDRHKGDEYDQRHGSDAGTGDLLDQEYECGVHRRPLVEVEALILFPPPEARLKTFECAELSIFQVSLKYGINRRC
jgi:hypothetical protein